MYKVCGTCKVEKPVSDFYKNKSKPDGLSSYCKLCKKQYNKEHYESRGYLWKETRAQQREANRIRCREWLFQYLSDKECLDCGTTDIRVLEFDHIRDKHKNVSSLSSLPALKREIEKCEIRCRNCHQIKTHERYGGSWREKMLAAMENKM